MSIDQYLRPCRQTPKKDTVKKDAGRKTNPCIDCQLDIRQCPWLTDGKAVPGWVTEESMRYNQGLMDYEPTYRIIRCPLYIRPTDRALPNDY